MGSGSVEKRKQTILRKYGVEFPSQNKSILEKIKQTNQRKYGTDWGFQSQEIKEKAKQTNLDKYCTLHHSQKHLDLETIEKLNDIDWLKNQHYKEKLPITTIAKMIGVTPRSVFVRFERNNLVVKNWGGSQKQIEVIDFLKSIYKGEIRTNDRTLIAPKEVDIYLPEENLAIEFDGTYWHSFDRQETIEEKQYHLNKTIDCREKGVQLLHIWEYEWESSSKKEIWKSILSNKLNLDSVVLYGRKCQVKDVSSKECRLFLDENHLQGYAASRHNLGLYYNDQLVSLMTFGKPRFSNKYDWEMIRFCNRKGIRIIGGAGKLLHHFSKKYNGTIVSYADRRIFDGNLYESLGFQKVSESAPNYRYFHNADPTKTLSRIRCQKHKLSLLLKEFTILMSESQNMFNNGYRRIWDCGNLVYMKEV